MASHWEDNHLILALKITARAARDQFQGLYDDRYKVAITAPPEDGKANKHLITFLAKTFGVAKKNVSVESGQFSPLKIIKIKDPQKIPPKWDIPKKP